MQTRGPATANDLSPSLVLVLGTAHVKETAELSSAEGDTWMPKLRCVVVHSLRPSQQPAQI